MENEGGGNDADRLFLEEVKGAIGLRQPPKTITICKDSDDPVHVISPSHENDGSVDQTASIDTKSFDDATDDDHNGDEIEILGASDRFDLEAVEDEMHNEDVPERYVLETSADDDSFPSRVSLIEDEEEATHADAYEELKFITRTLYKHLRRLDEELQTERSMRQSREKNLIKMAKEIIKGKDVIAKQSEKIEEMKEELKVERAEKALIEQRLEHQMFTFSEEQEDICKDLEQELSISQEVHKAECASYERRIHSMNAAHEEQREMLCNQLVEANRQNELLRDKLECARAAQKRRRLISFTSAKKDIGARVGSKTSKTRSIAGLMVLLYAIFALFQSSGNPQCRPHGLGSRSMVGMNGSRTDYSLSRTQTNSVFRRDAGLFSDQEAEWTPQEPLAGTEAPIAKRLGHHVNKLGDKLKKAVVREEGESYELQMKNAFLAAKQPHGDESIPSPMDEGMKSSVEEGWFSWLDGRDKNKT